MACRIDGGRLALRSLFFALVMLCSLPAAASADELGEVPFWRASSGWWLSDNTYFSPTLDYNLRAYASLVHIAIEGRRIIETEHKFMPAGPMALQAGRGLASEGEGVEQVTVTTFEQEGAIGTVRQVSVEPDVARPGTVTTIRIVGADTAQKVIRDPRDPYDLYRMFITMPTSDRRYLINYGLVSSAQGEAEPGSLRGLSTFHARRIDAGDFARLRGEMRRRFAVRILVVPGADHKPSASRID